MAELQLADVQAVRSLVDAVAVRTPMLESRWLSALAGVPVLLKCENLQRTGSFKVRGAAVRIARLEPEVRARGVVAASAGNHAQGVALAARQHDVPATVFMPDGAPLPKERATRSYGADIVFGGPTLEDCLALAVERAEETGATLIHPFDHADVIAGQGTLGLEIVEQCPDVARVLVPAGGGGLLAGVAVAIRGLRPETAVVGVQAAEAAAIAPSLAAGRPVRLERMATMADGIAVGRPGELTLPLVEKYVERLVTVTEESMSSALLALVEREKLVVEPAGAVAAAALADLVDAGERPDGPIVVVLSGGNIDPLLLGKVIQHGLAADGRYLSLDVRISDVPGALVRLLTEVADAGANVIEVAHERLSPTLHVGEVAVHLQLETRGAEHAEAVLARVREHGFVS